MKNIGIECMSAVGVHFPARGLLPPMSNAVYAQPPLNSASSGLRHGVEAGDEYRGRHRGRRAWDCGFGPVSFHGGGLHTKAPLVDKRLRRKRESLQSCVSTWVYRPLPVEAENSDPVLAVAVDDFLTKTGPTAVPTFPFGLPFERTRLPTELTQLRVRGDHELIHALIGRNHDSLHPVTAVLRHRGWRYNRALRCWYRRTANPRSSCREYDVLDVEYFEANHRQQLTGLKLVINFRWVHKQFE